MNQIAPFAQLQAQEQALAGAVRQSAAAVRGMGSPVRAALDDLASALADRNAALAADLAEFAGALLGVAGGYTAAVMEIAGPTGLALAGPCDMIDLAADLPGPTYPAICEADPNDRDAIDLAANGPVGRVAKRGKRK